MKTLKTGTLKLILTTRIVEDSRMNGSGSNEALNNNDVGHKTIMMVKAETGNAESSNNLNDKKRKNYEDASKDGSAKMKCQKKRKTSTHEVAPEHKEDLLEEVIL